MRKLVLFFALVSALLFGPVVAEAKVRISVDLSSQRMNVQADSGASYSWPISSARSGYVTPNGTYYPTSLQTMHRSKKYHNSPMPHSIFFRGGYAIHGTYAVGALGRPASHGCIRISPANAATLFSLVRSEGAVIQIRGAPSHHAQHVAHRHHIHQHFAHAHHHFNSALSYAPTYHSNNVQHIFRSVIQE